MLEDSVTGVGIGLEEAISLSVVIGPARVLDVLGVEDRVPGSDSDEE